jgi:hypothetical protein
MAANPEEVEGDNTPGCLSRAIAKPVATTNTEFTTIILLKVVYMKIL